MVLILKRFLRVFRTLTPFCQSGVNAGTMAALILIGAATPAAAETTGWAHQAAGFQSNGVVSVKSLAGGSYAGTQNPNGAVAKTNQSAATQPPTVIIQATGGSAFNYTSDCYILTASGSITMIGAGKLDAANNFTGILGAAAGGSNGDQTNGAVIFSALTGASLSQTSSTNTTYYWCGNSGSCAATYVKYVTTSGYYGTYIIGVAGMPTTTRQKCYP